MIVENALNYELHEIVNFKTKMDFVNSNWKDDYFQGSGCEAQCIT